MSADRILKRTFFKIKIFGVRIVPVVVGDGGGSEVSLKCTGVHHGRKNFGSGRNRTVDGFGRGLRVGVGQDRVKINS